MSPGVSIVSQLLMLHPNVSLTQELYVAALRFAAAVAGTSNPFEAGTDTVDADRCVLRCVL